MQKEPYSEREVAEGIWLVAGFHGGGIGVNAVVLTSKDHTVIVDTLMVPREARRVAKRFQRRGTEPLALVNTHWHTDHTAGNSLYNCPVWGQKSGARFLKIYWPKWVGGPRDKRAQGLRMKLPDRTFARQASIDLDGEELQLIYLPGHTTDSIGVWLPDRRILVAGDAVMELPFLYFGGNSQDSIRSLQKIRRMRPRMILQGHGPPCFPERLETDIRYLEKIRRAARRAQVSGVTRKKFVETPLDEFLPPSRILALSEPWRQPHYLNWLNLHKVWAEALKTRQ